MSTKLTLTIDKSVIEQAKKYAKAQGRSLSNLIEDYLKTVSGKPKEENDLELSPLIKSLLGSVKVPENEADYKELIANEMLKKYLK